MVGGAPGSAARCIQVGKATQAGVGFHTLKHPSRISLASCLGEKADFQRADRRGLTVQVEVLVRPSNYIIATALSAIPFQSPDSLLCNLLSLCY